MSRGKYHSSHRYKKIKGNRILKNGNVCGNVTLSKISWDNIDALAKKRDVSFMSVCGGLIEFALMELEEQGELVLNKFKHREIITSSQETIALIDSLIKK